MKAIAFYLPQFHPIPENDEWWGEGFTEWRNVAVSRPRFRKHHQPRVPRDLGFYDLRLSETRCHQARLAEDYGISGFCYYHYWFNGHLLLERPLNEMVLSGRPDFPFCICWANENWTRRWDGQDREILIAQEYNSYDPEEHISWLSKAFNDPRYLRVDGKPIFLIYNPSVLPGLRDVISKWREAAKRNKLPDLYLISVNSFRNSLDYEAADKVGFDASVEFYPSTSKLGRQKLLPYTKFFLPRVYNFLFHREKMASQLPTANVFSYERTVKNAMRAEYGDGSTVLPCVMPSWDNSARRRANSTVIQNDDPKLYEIWLHHAAGRVAKNPQDEQLVFINAWNEWAEGCYLEPDMRFGRAFLEATKAALQNFRS